jgi:D-alanyl-lipoteichoic acid acyltransferase DltB (MBOAT superfamily)
LYIPLGGNRRGRLRNHFNVLAVFTVSGLWHGASLNFVFWGFLNGTYHVLENMLDTVKKRIGYKKNIFTIAIGHAITFLLVTYAFIFFRIQDIAEGLRITGVIFNANNFKTLSFACVTDMGVPVPYLWALTGSLILLIIFDIAGRFINGVKIISQTIFIKYAAYFALIMLIIIFGYYGSSYDPQDFIYFQF